MKFVLLDMKSDFFLVTFQGSIKLYYQGKIFQLQVLSRI